MENSGNILFQGNQVEWFVAVGTSWIGPLSAQQVYEKIQNHELTWAHYVWKKGQAEWKRICDLKLFQAAVPHAPSAKPKAQTAAAPPPKAKQNPSLDLKIWYLHYQEAQFGPFSEAEILQFLKSGRINQSVFAWKDGMKTWEPIGKVENFRGASPVAPSSSKKSAQPVSENRDHPRRPLVAKIMMADEQSVIVGVCRDISIGGMQVLTEASPGKVGASLKMNISPSNNDGSYKIEPFTAEGVVVRILEDGRGFSFRFKPLTEKAKKSIESYIDSPA